MRQSNSTKQSRSKTRNQRKRERIQTVCMAVACLVLWGFVLSMMVNAWAEHPAEQHVSGTEYMETIGGDSDALS